MDLRQIRQFIAVADAQSFRKAAERLHMAQPPLSLSIRRLEAEIGAPLFIRGRRGVRPTDLAIALLDNARQVMHHAEQLRRQATAQLTGTSGRLSVAFVGSATYSLLPLVLPRFSAQYPDIALELREGTTTEILAQIQKGTLDLGLVRYPVFEEHAVRLAPIQWDRLVAVMPAANRLRERQRIALKDLADEPFVLYSANAARNLRGQVLLACQAAGFSPRIVQEAVQVQTIISLVESGLGVALVPGRSARHAPPGVVFRSLTSRAANLDVAIALASRDAYESATARRFREVLAAVGDEPGRVQR